MKAFPRINFHTVHHPMLLCILLRSVATFQNACQLELVVDRQPTDGLAAAAAATSEIEMKNSSDIYDKPISRQNRREWSTNEQSTSN